MLQVKQLETGKVLIGPSKNGSIVVAGFCLLAFGLIMLVHPTGWRSGVRGVDPNEIRAIGAAVSFVGFLLAYYRTTWLVDRQNDAFIQQTRLIIPIVSDRLPLSAFTRYEVRKKKRGSDEDQRTLYELCLVGPGRTLVLDSARTKAEVGASGKVLASVLVLRAVVEVEPPDND